MGFTPVFRKSECHLFKVYSPEKCVKVCTLKGHEEIAINHSAYVIDYEEATEDEFFDSYIVVARMLTELSI